MNRCKATAAVWAVCLVALATVGASGASAQEAFTCVKNGGSKDYGAGDSHCSNGHVTAGTGEYGHVAFTGKTSVTGSNESTGGVFPVWKLKAVESGITLELQATSLTATGEVENTGGNAVGTGVGTFTGVTATPAGCVEKSAGGVVGTLKTNEIKGSTAGLTNEVTFSPAVAGHSLAEFQITGCTGTAAILNHTYTVTGSLKGQASGSTINFTHTNTTGQGTLFLLGQKAGVEGTLTVKGPSGDGLALT
jgi:hypothetical protein